MVYSKQLAWLASVPKGSTKSRLERHKEIGAEPSFPRIDGYEYLVALLHQAGTVGHSGMGVVPLGWLEIEGWLRCSKLELTTWESVTIKEMSHAYAAEYSRGSDADREAPYSEIEVVDREAVANKVLAVFRSLMKKPEGE